MKNKMDLPKKDINGNSYLSYSQITLFKKDKDEYIRRYILKEPFIPNKYTDFGSKVGKALEENNFSNFSNVEQGVLNSVTRLDQFERKVTLNYDGFYILGFIDTNSLDLNSLIDYKTGGRGKEKQYSQNDYDQLCLYALSLRQETGITPQKAEVIFIRRSDADRDNLKVARVKPIVINIDITIDRLKEVYWGTLKIAKEIEIFYKKYKEEH